MRRLSTILEQSEAQLLLGMQAAEETVVEHHGMRESDPADLDIKDIKIENEVKMRHEDEDLVRDWSFDPVRSDGYLNDSRFPAELNPVKSEASIPNPNVPESSVETQSLSDRKISGKSGRHLYPGNSCPCKISKKRRMKKLTNVYTEEKAVPYIKCSYRNRSKHTGGMLFCCSLSPCNPLYRNTLNDRMLVDKEKSSVCDCSLLGTAIKGSLFHHMESHGKGKQVNCDKCSFTACQESQEAPMLTRPKNKRFKCSLCSYKTDQKGHMAFHILTHSTELNFKCEICTYRTKTRIYLKKHMMTHVQEKPFSCDLCSYRATEKRHLKAHRLKHGEKSFQCSKCSYKTYSNDFLKRHMETHAGEKHYACDLCPYRALQKRHLKAHLLKHGEKSFQCENCSYKTYNKNLLRSHMWIHTGEKQYACALCSYKASRKSLLREHLFSHAGEKPFRCAMCLYATTCKASLKKHLLIHDRSARE